MFKKVLSAATSTAVVAGLVSAGAVATATPAAAAPAANPNLIGCGIPITLVMDASGSISGDEITAMRSASKAFLAGLEDTGSTARIVEFAQTSKQLISRRDVAGAGLTQLNAAIDSYKSGGIGTTTNWESPLWRTFDEPIPGNKGLVVFLTDGDPNTVGGVNGSGTSGATATAATNAAEVYANQLKTAGNRMLGVGIGLSNTGQQDRLKQVTGPNLVTSIPANATINDFDAVVTDNFDDLSAALEARGGRIVRWFGHHHQEHRHRNHGHVRSPGRMALQRTGHTGQPGQRLRMDAARGRADEHGDRDHRDCDLPGTARHHEGRCHVPVLPHGHDDSNGPGLRGTHRRPGQLHSEDEPVRLPMHLQRAQSARSRNKVC